MSDEIKALADGIKSDLAALRKTHADALAAKADGKALADLEAKMAAQNAAIDAQSAKLDQMATAMKRSGPDGSAHKAGDAGERLLRKSVKQWITAGPANVPLGRVINDVLASDSALRAAYLDEHPEVKAMTVGDDSNGGFLVNADLSGRIVRRVFESSPIRQYAAVQSITSDALEGDIDANESDAEWVTEVGARTVETTPAIGKWRIATHELTASPKISQKLLDDAAIDVEAWLAGKTADKIARKENLAFVLGTGVGQPRGILTESTVSDGVAGVSSVANDGKYISESKIGYIPTGVADAFPNAPSAASDPAVMNPIVAAVYALKGQYRSAGSVFFMHRTTIGAVRTLRDNYGRYLWEPGAGMGQPSTLFGYAVAEFDDMPVLGATNKFAIGFGNLKEAYQIVDRLGMRILRDPFTAFPYVKFRTTKRVGGGVINHEAIKLIKFATT